MIAPDAASRTAIAVVQHWFEELNRLSRKCRAMRIDRRPSDAPPADPVSAYSRRMITRGCFMRRIFISYRRDDAAGDAGRLADHLQRRFGADRVFLDIDSIEPGEDFIRVLRTSLQQTAVMLVVIGPRWIAMTAPDGTRRLDDPDDFVRLEVETALGSDIPVVPVLVQAARMPRAEDLPACLAPLSSRQSTALDHAEFHDDAERLCDRLAAVIDRETIAPESRRRRWWPAAVITALAIVVAGYGVTRVFDGSATRSAEAPTSSSPDATPPLEQARLDALIDTAASQRRSNRSIEALSTLAQAREVAPRSELVRRLQEDVAMEWIRDVQVESGKSSFADAIKPALAVVDASLGSATGERRADLIAHQGWAAFVIWRDGNRALNPVEWYREALSLDPGNPYANAMLAHWMLLQNDDVPGAVRLFDTAIKSGRAAEAVRSLQWSAYGNSRTAAADAQRIRLADEMRRAGQKLSSQHAQALWAPYYFATPVSGGKHREVLLGVLPPDDHIRTLAWAFDEFAAADDLRRRTIRFYAALLHARAGRTKQASDDLRVLETELAAGPDSLRDATRAAIRQLQSSR